MKSIYLSLKLEEYFGLLKCDLYCIVIEQT